VSKSSVCPAKPDFIAHVRSNGDVQPLDTHLWNVGELAGEFASKFGLQTHGRLVGLLHDLGKYSYTFQSYIQSATGLLNQDEDEDFVDFNGLKGKIDHSSSGAQLVWSTMAPKGYLESIVAQILALCIASHHSGLIDCIGKSPTSPAEDLFTKRMNKSSLKTHLPEVLSKANKDILDAAEELMSRNEISETLQNWVKRIQVQLPNRDVNSPIFHQQMGLLARSLFSCLLDADRIDTADFENPASGRQRQRGRYEKWDDLVQRLETHLFRLASAYPIDTLRQRISQNCLEGAGGKRSVYTLTVPTGGGKTLASLRFALHHARKHAMDRIIYVIPFTSIIDQNAHVVRQILEPEEVESGSVVLENHSNLTMEHQSWRGKILSENWDAPIVYTTSVQLLETLFGSGTRGARRMHQLANSVLIFDEIQSLPVNCVHLFNNAMNYLVDFCNSTVVLCTATQPLLNRVDSNKGAIRIPSGNELIPDVKRLFDDLKRVEVIKRFKSGGWSQNEISELALHCVEGSGSCLVIVNTKNAAKAIFQLCKENQFAEVFHLSTNMCPAHRRKVLGEIRRRLDQNPPAPTLCVSTQLIEAGVDVDFGSVIRLAAGLDSIAQAAGRCNRNGRSKRGQVHLINPRPSDENLDLLPDIKIGRDVAERVLYEFDLNPEKFGNDIIGPKALEWYYENYFFARKYEMSYPVSDHQIGHDDTLLNLLSNNSLVVEDYRRGNEQQWPPICLRQSFMTAAKAFKAIDAPTRGLIVPFEVDGTELINDLCGAWLPENEFKLLRIAQQFSVNVFPKLLETLLKNGLAREIREGTGILYLTDKRFYSPNFGLSAVPEGNMEILYDTSQ
jgi:CRISPR-associated endonuclease/helicase Cas3